MQSGEPEANGKFLPIGSVAPETDQDVLEISSAGVARPPDPAS